jgi:hypothetical protein
MENVYGYYTDIGWEAAENGSQIESLIVQEIICKR